MKDPINNTTRSVNEPHDRLTRLAQRMTERLDAEPGTDDVNCIIMLQDGVRGGIVMHGYEEGEDALALSDLVGHVEALFNSIGVKFELRMDEGRPQG